MPAGTYDVYLGVDTFYADQPLLDVAGPWTVELLPAVESVPDLPAGFPVAEVPLPGGTVVHATQEPDGGWTLELAVDGDDRMARAVGLLAVDETAEAVIGSPGSPTSVVTPDGAWTVTVVDSHADGRDTLVYRLTPGRVAG